MNPDSEGWSFDTYYIFFKKSDYDSFTIGYGINKHFPELKVVGLIDWDTFILKQSKKIYFTCPCLPTTKSGLAKLSKASLPTKLEKDPRFTDKVLWRVQPIIFGGSPDSEDNMALVTYEQHQQLIIFWNKTFQNYVQNQTN